MSSDLWLAPFGPCWLPPDFSRKGQGMNSRMVYDVLFSYWHYSCLYVCGHTGESGENSVTRRQRQATVRQLEWVQYTAATFLRNFHYSRLF